MKKNQKIMVHIIVVLLLLATLMTGTVLILKAINEASDSQDSPQSAPTSEKESADTLQTRAVQAIKNNEPQKAKKLLQEARLGYERLDNWDGIAAVDAQLYLIDHPTVAPEVEAKPVPTATR